MTLSKLKIGNKTIGENRPCFVTAEVACGHDGKYKVADKLIDIAAEAKADAIKFHHHHTPDYMTPNHPILDFIKKINFSYAKWKQLYEKARKKGLAIMSMPNDLTSLKLTERLGTDAYYLHSANLGDLFFIKEMAKTKKPILIGTGATSFNEIKEMISLIKSQGNNKIILMHGYQAYPTKLEENHLKMINTIKKRFRVPVGFCDHTDGGDEIAKIIPLIAASFGAMVIEKHFTTNRKLKMTDFQSALDPEDFKEFIKNLRLIEKTFGSAKPHPFTKDEMKYRKLVKTVVAKHDIKAGKKLDLKDIAFKRSKEQGISPFEIKKILGKRTKKKIKKDDRILPGSLK